MFTHEVQRRFNRCMRAVATGIKFIRGARLHDIQRRAPGFEHTLGVKLSGTVEQIEIALLVRKRAGIRGKALAREQRRHQPAARALPDVQRFNHGAEIGLVARGQRGAHRQRGCGLFHR